MAKVSYTPEEFWGQGSAPTVTEPESYTPEEFWGSPTPIAADEFQFDDTYDLNVPEFNPADYLTEDENGLATVSPDVYATLQPNERKAVNQVLVESQREFTDDPQAWGTRKALEDGDGIFTPDNSNALERTYSQVMNDLGGTINNWLTFDQDTQDENARDMRRSTAALDQLAVEDSGGFVGGAENLVRGGASSIAKFGYASTGGSLVGGPLTGIAAGIATFAGDAYNDAHAEAVDIGLSEEQVKSYATTAATIEGGITAAMSLIGLGGFEKVIPKSFMRNLAKGSSSLAPALAKRVAGTVGDWKAWKPLIKTIGSELVEENAIELANAYNRVFHEVDPNATDGDKLWENFKQTTLQTLVTMGMAKGVRSLTDFGDNPSRSNAKKAGLDKLTENKVEREKIAKLAKDALTAKEFKAQLDATATSQEEADSLYSLVEARAEAIGESTDEYVGKRFKEVKRGDGSDVSEELANYSERDSLDQTAYHGTPHNFDKFTLDRIGTGEGAQAYGWGLYFAGEKQVAEYYRKGLSRKHFINKARNAYNEYDSPNDALDLLRDGGELDANQIELLEALQEDDWLGFDYPHQAVQESLKKGATDRYDMSDRTQAAIKKQGSLYKVDLKPEDSELLHWDLVLEDQSKSVQDAVVKLILPHMAKPTITKEPSTTYGLASYYRVDIPSVFGGTITSYELDREVAERRVDGAARKSILRESGKDIHEALDRLYGNQSSNREVSELLHKQGVRGIKYLDELSRGEEVENVTHNYVIFDGADVAIEEVLEQRQKDKHLRGNVRFANDGRAIISAFEQQNISTLLHEIGHVFRRDLSPQELGTVTRWAGLKKEADWQAPQRTDYRSTAQYNRDRKKWRDAEEKFARGFETYLRSGKAPTNKLKQVFAKYKKWLTNVYRTIKGSPLAGAKLNQEMRTMLDGFLGGEVEVAQKPSVAVSEPTPETGVQTAPDPLGASSEALGRLSGEQASTQSELPVGAVSGGVLADAISGNLSDLGASIHKGFRKWFNSGGLANKETLALLDKRDGEIAAQSLRIKHGVRDAYKAAKKKYGKVTEQVARDLDAALKDPSLLAALPPDIQLPLQQMRDHADGLSRIYKSMPGVAGTDLEMTIDENLGVYVTRTYKKFEAPNWAEEAMADPQIMSDFRADVRSNTDNANLSDDEIDVMARRLLSKDIHALGDDSGLTPAARQYAKSLKKRKDLPEAVRRLYGENLNAFANYVTSAQRLSQLVAHKQFVQDLKQVGLSEGFFTSKDTLGNIEQHTQVNPELRELAPLSDVFMAPEIAEAINEIYTPQSQNKLLRTWVGAMALPKMAATVFSVTATVRNLKGGSPIMFANGSFSPTSMAGAAKLTWWNDLLNKGDAATRKEVERLTRLGLFSGVNTDELISMAKEAVAAWDDTLPGAGAANAIKKAPGGIAKVYQSMDAVRKIATFYDLRKGYQKAFPDMPDAELDVYVSNIIHDIDPTYSRAWRGARAWSRYIPLGPFVTFNAEMLRTTVNRSKLIKREISEGMKTGNKHLVAMGVRKLVGQALVLSADQAILSAIHGWLGIGDDEEEEVRKRLAPWSKNSSLLITEIDKVNQTVAVRDISYSDPYNIFKKPVTALLRGKPWEAAAEATDFVLGEDIFTGMVMSIKRNRDANGRPVYDEGVSAEQQFKQIVAYGVKWMKPGTLRGLDRILSKETREERIKEAKAFLTGNRDSSFDIQKANYYRNRDFSRTMHASSRSILHSMKTKPLDELEELMDSANRKRFATFQEWHEFSNGMKILGSNAHKSLVRDLDGATGGTKHLAKEVYLGTYRPYTLSKVTREYINSLPDGKQRMEIFKRAYAKWRLNAAPGPPPRAQ